MVEPLERRIFQLRQSPWNDATQPGQRSRQPAAQPHVQAVDQEVPTAEMSCVANEFVDRQTDGRVIRRDDRTRTRADDDVDRDFVLDELVQDADMACAPQAAAAQHEADPERRAISEPLPRGLARVIAIGDVCHLRQLSRAAPGSST